MKPDEDRRPPQLIHGDCLVEMDAIPDGSVDLTVTSPPYDNLRTYNGNNAQWNEQVWKGVLQQLYRVTKEGGVVVWIVADATINGSETGTSFRQALWAMECGFRLHDTMIWKKVAIPHDPKNQRYWPAFDYMFVWSKGIPSICNYIKIPCAGAGRLKTDDYGQRRADGSKLTDRHDPCRIINETKVIDNVWSIEIGTRDSIHPATFPERLAHDHIVSWSNKGNTILDPFMGSGTTGVACKRLDRHFIGIELGKGYFDMAAHRIATAEVQTELEFT